MFSVAKGETCFLFEADITTGVVHRMTDAASGCESDPAFSPDGRQLAFMRAPQPGARAALIIANPNGRDERTLVSGEEDNLEPIFIPESNRILFLRSAAFEHHSPLVDNRRHKFDLFSADLASGEVTTLTHNQFYEISHTSVSADGQQVILSVFDSEGNVFLAAPIANPAMPTLRLQPTVPGSPNPRPVIYNAIWLRDGDSLLFSAAVQPPGRGNFDYNVYRLTISTGAIDQLTHGTGVLDGFALSPDASKIVFLRHAIYSILDLGSRKLKPIPLQVAAP